MERRQLSGREVRTCGVGYEGCDCDVMPDGQIIPFCECHDCHVCGELDCDGHRG